MKIKKQKAQKSVLKRLLKFEKEKIFLVEQLKIINIYILKKSKGIHKLK